MCPSHPAAVLSLFPFGGVTPAADSAVDRQRRDGLDVRRAHRDRAEVHSHTRSQFTHLRPPFRCSCIFQPSENKGGLDHSKSYGKGPAALSRQHQPSKDARSATRSGRGHSRTAGKASSSKAMWPAGVRSGRGQGGTAARAANGGGSRSKDGEMLVGKRIDVWWAFEERYWRGTVLHYDVVDRSHRVLYDDGEMKWHLLDDFYWRRYSGAPWIRPTINSATTRSVRRASIGRATTQAKAASTNVAAAKKSPRATPTAKAAKARTKVGARTTARPRSKIPARNRNGQEGAGVGGDGVAAAAARGLSGGANRKKPQRKTPRQSRASSCARTALSDAALGRCPAPISRTGDGSDNSKKDYELSVNDSNQKFFFPCSADDDEGEEKGMGRHSPHIRPICAVTVAPLAESEDEVDGMVFVQGSRLLETTVLTDHHGAITTVHRRITPEAPWIDNRRPRVPGTRRALATSVNLVTKAPNNR